MQLRRILILLTFICGSFSRLESTNQSHAQSPDDYEVFSLPSISGDSDLPGRIFEPTIASVDNKRPLVLFLHGAGQLGSDNRSQVGNLNGMFAEAQSRGFYLYAPQTDRGWGSTSVTDDIATMLDLAKDTYHVDTQRVYVTGYSMGGGGTWNMLNRHGDRFAAGIPIAGASPSFDFDPSNLLQTPLWAIHGGRDMIVSPTVSRNVFNEIIEAAGETPFDYPPLPFPRLRDPPNGEYRSALYDLRYTEIINKQHDLLRPVYAMPEIYDWMLSQSVPEPTSGGLAVVALLIWQLNARRNSIRKR